MHKSSVVFVAVLLTAAPAYAIPIGSSAPSNHTPFRLFTQQMTGALGSFSSFWRSSPHLAPVAGGTDCGACGAGAGFVITLTSPPIAFLPPAPPPPAAQDPAPPGSPNPPPPQTDTTAQLPVDLPQPPVPVLSDPELNTPPNSVPEPASLALFGLGLAALRMRGKQRSR